MSNRMRSNQLRGRSIVNDSAIHSLFSQLTDSHGSVLQRMAKLETDRSEDLSYSTINLIYFEFLANYETLQDHLAHIQEARQAVNLLRQEHQRLEQEKLREEQNQRQAQLQQTLGMMRVKKQVIHPLIFCTF